MKRIIAVVLACMLVISGCGNSVADNDANFSSTEGTNDIVNEHGTDGTSTPLNETEELLAVDSKVPKPEPTFSNLNDPELLKYVESTVYQELQNQLGTDYIIEGVSSIYISKEYIEELNYNSQENVFFGYKLSELDEQFQGERYVFTLGENGETIVVPFEDYDDTYEKVLKNVAIGTGVILVCVTVSVVSGGLGAPAVSLIFASSAKTGAIFAASSGAFSGVIAAAITGIQTGDLDQAIKAGALAGSESFKWGAIGGAIAGGGTELVTLKVASQGGLTLDEAAIIIKDSKLPSNFVRQIHSMDEYYELLSLAEKGGLTIQEMSTICMTTGYPLELVKLFGSAQESTIYFEQAGLYAETLNGQNVLIRTIDLSYESELAGKTVTNLERMKMGYAAIDPASGQAFQLHHIGQTVDSPLAILSQFEHTGGGNNSILHNTSIQDGEGVHSLLSDSQWATQREEFWKALAELLSK